ncbi:MAG: tetratricopeptide repeat protein, partial [Anaerolineae bacterium]|nr:tetratricopeptide repeat protein [Anaerolineae bacterium]
MTSLIPRKLALLLLAAIVCIILIALLPTLWNTLARDTWIRSAEASIRQNDFAAALDAANRALSLEPDHPALLRLRGRVFMYLYEWDHALADYDHALQLAP